MPAELCPEQLVARAAALAGEDSQRGLGETEALLLNYPGDPRLQFLHGSLLAALARYGEAASAMRRALEAAPEFHIARFQLGLLLLSSGAASDAAETWAPLQALEANDALRLFAEGLQLMAKDRFVEAERQLRQGLEANRDHPMLNKDILMVIEQMREASRPGRRGDEESQAHWLLQVAAVKQTKH